MNHVYVQELESIADYKRFPLSFFEVEFGDGQNTDPQSMDYPNGLPKWTTLKGTTHKILFHTNTTLRSCDFLLTLDEPALLFSAWPSAAIFNNYTE